MIVSSTSLPPLPLLSPVPPLPRSASTSGITSAPLLVGACMVNEMGIGRGNKGLSLSVTLGFCMVHNFGIGLGNKCNGLRFGIFMTRFMLCNRFMRCVRRMRCNCVWLAPCCRKSAIALATYLSTVCEGGHRDHWCWPSAKWKKCKNEKWSFSSFLGPGWSVSNPFTWDRNMPQLLKNPCLVYIYTFCFIEPAVLAASRCWLDPIYTARFPYYWQGYTAILLVW